MDLAGCHTGPHGNICLVLTLGNIDKCLVTQLYEIHELTHNSGKSQQ